jgi:glycosyltransferase involved in cell wall biosynthesis
MMSQVPGPTVLLATFNGAATLREQLDSYLAQTAAIERIIASDDGSRDDTVHILQTFRNAHPEIHVEIIYGPRKGAAQNFLHLLRCLPENPGPVLFSDQDDVWLPQKVAAGVSLLAQHPSDHPVLVGGRTFVCDERLRKLHLSRRPDPRQRLIPLRPAGQDVVD